MHSNKLIICLLMLAIAANSCVKQKFDTPALAEFASSASGNTGSYFITSDAGTEFKVPVGITTSSNKDRVINFTVTSPSGAVAGTQYNLTSSGSITIPAGKVEDSISIKGVFSAYPAGKIDTLIFTISGGDVPAFNGSDKYTLTLQKYCDVVSTDLIGDFTNTGDFYQGDPSTQNPYTASISNWTSTGSTTATITIKNLGLTSDDGFGPFDPTDAAATGLTANLDWTDPSNFTITVPSQPYRKSIATYGAGTIAGSGSFSSCLETFTITYTVSVGIGDFDPITTVLAR